jgi:hypothetical protein
MLIFQQFIHSWCCYELVNVAFDYFSNRQHEHKEMALMVLDTLFDKTKHNSYFDKIILGSKQNNQPYEESHTVLGYINMVAVTTTVLL